MLNLNEVTVVGNLGQNPKTFDTPRAKGAFVSLATTESWKDRNGEWQERTTWLKLFAQGAVGERLAKLEKGDCILVRGSINSKTNEVVLQSGEGLRYQDWSVSAQWFKVVKRKNPNTDPRRQALADAEASGVREPAGEFEDDIPF